MGGSGPGRTGDGGAGYDPEHPENGGLPTVPDDASSLEPDRRLWLAEERARRRGERLRRLTLTRRGDRHRISGRLVILVLGLTTVIGVLFVLAVPAGVRPPPGPAPLADVPVIAPPAGGTQGSAPTGTGRGASAPPPPTVEPAGGMILGRRLPEVVLDSDAGPLAAPALRPAVVLLLPQDCACTAGVRSLYRQARMRQLSVWLVSAAAAGADRTDLVELDEKAAFGGARWARDPTATLHRVLMQQGLTAVLVAPDGVVSSVVRYIPASGQGVPALEPLLARLTPPVE